MKDCKTCIWFGKEKPSQCENYLCRNQSEYDPKEELYTMYRKADDGENIVDGYAYGPPWVSQALLMDDIKFRTPEEARAWWEKEKAREKR